jgi:predicted DNA-binding protein (MmcQ/YjbR family)
MRRENAATLTQGASEVSRASGRPPARALSKSGANSTMTGELREAAATLREFALGLPEAQEDFPWGDRVVKVNKKIFAFLGKDLDSDANLGFCVKLPDSSEEALKLPFTKPAGYGLGKHGWVVVEFTLGKHPPVELFLRWIEESYRSIAPKKLLSQLESPLPAAAVVRQKPPSRRRKTK